MNRRPPAAGAASSGSLISRTRGGTAGASVEETAPLQAAAVDSQGKGRDIGDGRREWSTFKHIRVALMFVALLWVVCYAVTLVTIEALLRMTS